MPLWFAGRIDHDEEALPGLNAAHAEFFASGAAAPPPGLPVRRVVAAPDFGSSWPGIVERFTTAPRDDVVQAVGRYSQRGRGKEFRRFLDLEPAPGMLTPGVGTLDVPLLTE